MKKLEVGVTKIAEVTVLNPETKEHISVPLYYGNHIEIGNTLGMVSKKQYYACLDTFFNTEEGHKYDRPDDQQIEADIEVLHCGSKKSSNNNKETNKKQEKDKIQNPVLQETQNSENNGDCDNPEIDINVSYSKGKSCKKKQNSMMELFDLGTENKYINEIQSETIEKPSAKIPGKYGFHKTIEKPNINKKQKISSKTEVKPVQHVRKKRNIFKLTTVLLMILCAGMGFYIYSYKLDDRMFEVIQLVRDVSKGEKITSDDLEEVEIPISQYEEISNSTFIDIDGKETKDSLVLYANRNQIEGKYATDDLKEGDYLTVSSYTNLSLNENNIIHMQLDDGTEVQIKGSDLDAGKSTVHLYAVISSSNEDGRIINTAVDLGKILFEGKALTDILNQEGISLIQNNVSEN